MKCVVVFYSLTGSTKRVAERIAGDLNCDLEEIRETRPRRGFFGFLKSGYEALRKKLPPIQEPRRDVSGYDLVVFGTPVWGGTMASPLRTFISRYGQGVRKAAFFCTAGGSAGRTFREMETVLGRTGIAELPLVKAGAKSRNVFETVWVNRIRDFTSSLKAQVGERRSEPRARAGAAPGRIGAAEKTAVARAKARRSTTKAGGTRGKAAAEKNTRKKPRR